MFFDNAQELLDQYDQDKIDRTRHVDIIIYHSKTVDSFGGEWICARVRLHASMHRRIYVYTDTDIGTNAYTYTYTCRP